MSARSVDVTLVTSRELPDLDADDRPLAAELARRGLAVAVVAWDDAAYDWGATQLALVRSPWDYHHRVGEFLSWAERIAARTALWNPAAVLRWNLHKGYLLELTRAGAPVVPTALLRRGPPADLARLARERGWRDLVVKPAVSADSWETHFVGAAELAAGQAHVDRLQPARDLLVQPFLAAVENAGERCLVFLDGEFSHAVRKNALTRGGRWAGLPEGEPEGVAADELAAARRVLAAQPWRGLLYARVDLLRDGEGVPRLLELELAEPTLFLVGCAAGLRRLADGVERRLAAAAPG